VDVLVVVDIVVVIVEGATRGDWGDCGDRGGCLVVVTVVCSQNSLSRNFNQCWVTAKFSRNSIFSFSRFSNASNKSEFVLDMCLLVFGRLGFGTSISSTTEIGHLSEEASELAVTV